MKHNLLTTLLLLTATLTTGAASYDYFVFRTSDGTQVTMDAKGLKMIVQNGTLTATNGDIVRSFALTKLNRMFFSNTPQGDNATIVSPATDSRSNSTTSTYDISGRQQLQNTKPQKGIYIIKQGKETTKKVVR